MINEVHSSGIALINDGKIFLIKPFLSKDRWGIPKGHIEIRENSEKTALREFYEETGIKIIGIIKPFIDVTTKFKNTKKIVNVYKCVTLGNETFKSSNIITEGKFAGNPENLDGKWFTYNEALEIMHPYQIPIVEKLKYEDNRFKTFIYNREPSKEMNELKYNKVICILLYDVLDVSSDDLVLLNKYSAISDSVIIFSNKENYKHFDEYISNNMLDNILLKHVKYEILISDIANYINHNLKNVDIIFGSKKSTNQYRKFYKICELLKDNNRVNILDPKKYTV